MNQFVDYIQMNYPEIWMEFHQKMIDERNNKEEEMIKNERKTNALLLDLHVFKEEEE